MKGYTIYSIAGVTIARVNMRLDTISASIYPRRAPVISSHVELECPDDGRERQVGAQLRKVSQKIEKSLSRHRD